MNVRLGNSNPILETPRFPSSGVIVQQRVLDINIVLYSRLHLILRNQKLLKRILWMIIVDAIIFHIPTTVLTFGSNSNTDTSRFVHGYNVMEKIQMTGFCIQEFILSGIYLWESAKFHKTDNQEKSRKTLHELFYINMIIIMMDLSLLSLEYANLYILEILIKGVVYSVKLKIEFAILGKLVQYVTPQSRKAPSFGLSATPDFVHVSHSMPDMTQAPSKPRQALKRLWTDDLNGISDARFEHIETKNDNLNRSPELGNRTEPIKGPHSTVSYSEDDDIEKMMKRYSVKEGLS